jgi:hypothetical protein
MSQSGNKESRSHGGGCLPHPLPTARPQVRREVGNLETYSIHNSVASLMERPWLKLYTRDWLDNKELRRCSPAARAVLLDLMCLAHEGAAYGFLEDKIDNLSEEFMASRCMMPIRQFKACFAELINAERVHESEIDPGRFYIRRMVEDERIRIARAAGGSLSAGNPKLTSEYNAPGFIYLAKRSVDGAVKIGIALNPKNRIYKLRSSTKVGTIELLETFEVADMGTTEASLHKDFAAKKIDGEWFKLTEDDIKHVTLTLKGKRQTKNGSIHVREGALPSDHDSAPVVSGVLVLKENKDGGILFDDAHASQSFQAYFGMFIATGKPLNDSDMGDCFREWISRTPNYRELAYRDAEKQAPSWSGDLYTPFPVNHLTRHSWDRRSAGRSLPAVRPASKTSEALSKAEKLFMKGQK